MSFQISKPSILLSQYVKQYWAMDDCLPQGQKHVQRIIPCGLMELTFYLGDKPKSLDQNKLLTANSILSGQQKSYYDLEVSGKLSLFSVSLQPCGAKALFDIPSTEFFDQNIPLKYILKNKISELEYRLYESVTFPEKTEVVEKFLISQIKNFNKKFETERMVKSIDQINRSKGLIDIATLSASACLSRKQYERTFSSFIGTSPKQFLRTLRFQNTLLEKQKNTGINLTELAHTCGYFDQSHMINDYKLFSGKTPSQYFAESEPFSDYFQ